MSAPRQPGNHLRQDLRQIAQALASEGICSVDVAESKPLGWVLEHNVMAWKRADDRDKEMKKAMRKR